MNRKIVVKGGDLYSRGCEFEVRHQITYWMDNFHISLLYNLIEKTENKQKEAGVGTSKKREYRHVKRNRKGTIYVKRPTDIEMTKIGSIKVGERLKVTEKKRG